MAKYVSEEATGLKPDERTAISELYHSDLPQSEKTFVRMCDDGTTLLTGGMEPTPHLMSSVSYHLLANPEILARVWQELDAAMPRPDSPVTWSQLEALPYFVGP